MKKVFILLLALFLAGCGESDLSGDAFIVMGDSSVRPLSGETIYLIPIESENELFFSQVSSAYQKFNLTSILSATAVGSVNS